jgi:hypothetical protein
MATTVEWFSTDENTKKKDVNRFSLDIDNKAPMSTH